MQKRKIIEISRYSWIKIPKSYTGREPKSMAMNQAADLEKKSKNLADYKDIMSYYDTILIKIILTLDKYTLNNYINGITPYLHYPSWFRNASQL